MNCLTEETAFELSLETIWKLKEMTWTETQAADPLCSGNLQVVCPRIVQKPIFLRNTGHIGKEHQVAKSQCVSGR